MKLPWSVVVLALHAGCSRSGWVAVVPKLELRLRMLRTHPARASVVDSDVTGIVAGVWLRWQPPVLVPVRAHFGEMALTAGADALCEPADVACMRELEEIEGEPSALFGGVW